MRKSKKEKKRILAAAIAIFLAALMLLGSIAPFLYAGEVGGNFEVTAEIGYSGIYKPGYPTLVKIFITNTGNDFKGEVLCKIPFSATGEEQYGVYSKEVELVSGASAEIEMEIRVQNAVSKEFIIELTAGKNILYSEKVLSDFIDPESIMGIVLSEEISGLQYLKNMKIDVNSSAVGKKLIFADERMFPKTSSLLSNFSFIIVNDFDLNKLNEQQIDSMENFVNTGGVLVFGTGASYQKVLPYLSKFIDSNKGAEFSDLNFMDVSIDHVPLFEFEAEGGAVYSEEGFLVTKKINQGNGSVLIFSYDLSNDFAAEKTIYEFTADLIAESIGHESNFYLGKRYISTRKFEILPATSTPIVLLIFIVLGCYIAFIGPVLYLILKKKDKREYGFIIIPVLSVTAAVLIYLLSFSTPYKKPIVNKFNYIYLDNAEGTSYKSDLGLMYYKSGDFDISIQKDGISSITVDSKTNYNNYYYSSYYTSDTKNNFKLTESKDQWKLDLYQLPSWDVNYITYESTLNNREFFHAKVEVEDNKIVGKVMNDSVYDYEDIIVKYGSFVQRIGDLKQGEQISFEIPPSYFYSRFIYTDTYSLLSGYSYYTDGYQENEIKAANIADMEENLAKDGKINFNGGQLIIHGCNTADIFNEDIKAVGNKNPKIFNRNVYSLVIPVDAKINGIFEIDYGMLTPTDISSLEYFYEYELNGQIIELYNTDNYAEVTYEYENYENINEFQFRIFDSYDASYELYNYAKEEYEKLSFKPYTSAKVQSYFDSGGTMTVRISPLEETSCAVPSLRMKGEVYDAGN